MKSEEFATIGGIHELPQASALHFPYSKNVKQHGDTKPLEDLLASSTLSTPQDHDVIVL